MYKFNLETLSAMDDFNKFDEVVIDLIRQDKDDPETHEEAMALLRIIVKSQDPELVGRMFTAKIVELALANYPGWFSKDAIGSGTPFIVYWPALINSKYVKETVHINGKEIEVLPTNQLLDHDSMYAVVANLVIFICRQFM